MRQNLLKIISALVLSNFLACAIGSDYERPKSELSKSFASDQKFSTADPSLMWWKYFNDTTLNALIDEALLSNHDIDAAIARVNEARALTWETRLDLLPQITANGGYYKGKSSEAALPFIDDESLRRVEYYNAGFDANWEIDIFGRSQRAIEASIADRKRLVATLDDVLVSTISETASTYFNYVSAERNLKLAQRELRLNKMLFTHKQRLYETGEIDRREFLTARITLIRSKQELPTLKSNVEQNKNALAVLTGKNPTTFKIKTLAAPKVFGYRGPINIGTPEALLKRRPDVRSAEQNLIAANARAGYELGDLLPKLNFTGSFEYQAIEYSKLGNYDPGYVINPYISWVGLDFGRVLASINAADEKYNATLAEYQQALKVAVADVQDKLAIFSAERQRFWLMRDLTQSQKAISRLDRLRYRSGDISELSLVESRISRVKSLRELTDSKNNLNNSLIAIYKSLGGGWESTTLSQADS